ncbi:hypothetical protein ACFYM7_35920 [Streptomyces cyaneofuscatus]|uniref:hypothetical protein n=1 Tax=Streptomyces cyaneofuscatus TaxID=66883 RepID=UPI0036A5BBDD
MTAARKVSRTATCTDGISICRATAKNKDEWVVALQATTHSFQPKSPEMMGAAMMAPPEMMAAAMVAKTAMTISSYCDLEAKVVDEKNVNRHSTSTQWRFSGHL